LALLGSSRRRDGLSLQTVYCNSDCAQYFMVQISQLCHMAVRLVKVMCLKMANVLEL
jgi:hypothetical protein